jgi:hypothetical protein
LFGCGKAAKYKRQVRGNEKAMGSGLSRFLIVAAAVASCLALAPGSRAQTNPDPNHNVSLTLDGSSGSVVTTPAASPSFHMNFLLDDGRRLSDTPLGSTRDLEISLTSPDTPAFRFIFSPRAQFGVGYDPLSGTNRAYAGVTWDLFSTSNLFGHFGLASSFDPGLGNGIARRFDQAPLMLHGAVELGYRLDPQNSVLFAIDQGYAPGARAGTPETVDNFVLRYGTKF